MKIKLTGSSGYLGKLIAEELQKNGHSTEGIPHELLYGRQEELKEKITGTAVIINLAGVPIFTRWTEENKKKIYDSRVTTTQNLVKAINDLPDNLRPKKLISASAIGIYKPGKTHDEESMDFEDGFVGKVVKDWEVASKGLTKSVLRIIFRIAPVYGAEAETIKNLWFPFNMGVGGKIGDGKQPFPFVHEKDVSGAFVWAVENYRQSDVFNLSAPQNITNKEFTKTLAGKIHRPAVLPIPGAGLKLLFGKAAGMLTKSPQIDSKKLQEAGYQFRYPTIDETLAEIVQQKNPAS